MTDLTKTKAYFDRLVNIHTEIDTLTQDLGQLKEEVKEKLPDVNFTDLSRAAKLQAQQKLGQTVDKMNSFVDLAEAVTGA